MSLSTSQACVSLKSDTFTVNTDYFFFCLMHSLSLCCSLLQIVNLESKVFLYRDWKKINAWKHYIYHVSLHFECSFVTVFKINSAQQCQVEMLYISEYHFASNLKSADRLIVMKSQRCCKGGHRCKGCYDYQGEYAFRTEDAVLVISISSQQQSNFSREIMKAWYLEKTLNR